MPQLPNRHPGIRVDKISPQGEKAGLLFTVGLMAMILISLPSARVFFALSFPTGILVGLILYLIHRRSSRRERLISLHIQDAPDHRAVHPRQHPSPRISPASAYRVEKSPPLGVMGLVFFIGAMAAMAIILISLPAARVFFAWSFPAGIIVGLILFLVHRRPVRHERIMSLHL